MHRLHAHARYTGRIEEGDRAQRTSLSTNALYLADAAYDECVCGHSVPPTLHKRQERNLFGVHSQSAHDVSAKQEPLHQVRPGRLLRGHQEQFGFATSLTSSEQFSSPRLSERFSLHR